MSGGRIIRRSAASPYGFPPRQSLRAIAAAPEARVKDRIKKNARHKFDKSAIMFHAYAYMDNK